MGLSPEDGVGYVSELSNIYDATWIWHELIGWFWIGDWNADQSRTRWLYSMRQKCGCIGKVVFGNNKVGLPVIMKTIFTTKTFVRLIIRNEIIDPAGPNWLNILH